MLAIPVAKIIFLVADNNSDVDANGSRNTASGTHTVPKPIVSSCAIASCAFAIGCRSSSAVHSPTRPRLIVLMTRTLEDSSVGIVSAATANHQLVGVQ